MNRLPDIMTPDGRRAWAFAALFGASLVFTLFIAWGLWHLREAVRETFWLAIAAHVQLIMVIGGFAWVLGRRMLLQVNRDGGAIDDRDPVPESRIAAQAPQSMTAADPEIEVCCDQEVKP